MLVFRPGASAVFRGRQLNVVGFERKSVGDEGTLSVCDDPKVCGRRSGQFLCERRADLTDLRTLLLEVLQEVLVGTDRFSGALDVARTRGKEFFV